MPTSSVCCSALPKLVTEYINRGESYVKVRKVYSVNIVYFSLGHGTDFVYHGKTEFRGITPMTFLNSPPFQKQTFKVDTVSQLYPRILYSESKRFQSGSQESFGRMDLLSNTGGDTFYSYSSRSEEARERLKLDSMTKMSLLRITATWIIL